MHRRTVRQALASAIPPPCKTDAHLAAAGPFKKAIDDMLRSDLDAGNRMGRWVGVAGGRVQALLFHGCEQLLAGLLAAAAGFGAHAAVLVHRSVPLTLVGPSGRGRDGIPGRQIPEVLRRARALGAGRDELLARLDGDLVGASQHAN